MSSGPLENVGPGDMIPLDRVTWNALIGAGREYLRSNGGFDAPNLPGGPSVPQTTIQIQNNTGGDLVVFSVVAIAVGTPPVSVVDLPHDVRQKPILYGSTPAAATDAFAVLIEPIASGQIGRAAVLGVVPVSIHINDAAHGYAAPGASTASLESAATGPAKIIYKESSGTTRKALVLIQGGTGVTGTGTDTHVAIWNGTSTPAIKDSDAAITNSTSITKAASLRVQAVQEATAGDHAVSDLYSVNASGLLSSYVRLRGISGTATDTFGEGFDLLSSLAYSGSTVSGVIFGINYVEQQSSGGVFSVLRHYPRQGGGLGLNFWWDFAPWATFNGIVRATQFVQGSGGAYGGGSDNLGYTGTLTPGMSVNGGIITSAGAGSFVSTAAANTFTNTQTITSGANVPALSLQQTSSDASNTLQSKNAAGSVTFSVTGAGDVTGNSFTGGGSGLTGLSATQLTSGTVPDARIGTPTRAGIAALAAGMFGCLN